MDNTKPIAKCQRCGHYTYREDLINKRCIKSAKGKRCKGTYRSMINPIDWQECEKCFGKGCLNCQDTGKIDVRQ